MAAIAPQYIVLDNSYLSFSASGKCSGWHEKTIYQMGAKLNRGDIVDLQKLEITIDRISELITLLIGHTACSEVTFDISQFNNKYSLGYLLPKICHTPSILISGCETPIKKRVTLKVNFKPPGPQTRMVMPLVFSPSPVPPSPRPLAPSPTQTTDEKTDEKK